MRYRTAGKPGRIARTAAAAFLIGASVVSVAALAGPGMADAAVAKRVAVTAKAKTKTKVTAKARARAKAKVTASKAVVGKAVVVKAPAGRSAVVVRTVRVGSVAALLAAVAAAQPGDRIELGPGGYTLSDTLQVEASGTATAPIVIAAAAGAKPEIRGDGTIEVTGSYVTLDGLTFVNADTVRVSSTATHAKVTRNLFHLARQAQNWLQISGDDTEVDHNQFIGKQTAGVFLQIIGGGTSDMAERVWVHHNYFADHSFSGSNGGEAIRLGVSARQKAMAGAIVEDNLMERVNGDQEAISVKSSGNIIRRNTIRDSKGTITLRHGNGNTVEGNLLLGGTTGIRVFGNDQTVINNVVQDSTRNRLIEVGGGDMRDDRTSEDDHDAADRVLVAFNTVVTSSKTSTALDIGDSDDDVDPDSVTVADNILVSGRRAADQERGTRLNWIGNLGAGAIDGFTAGFRAADTKLVKDAGGVYRPGGGSAATGTAIGSWAVVALDVDGQVRPGLKRSVGADEPSANPATNVKPATKLSLGLS
jgi:Chondroitinase B